MAFLKRFILLFLGSLGIYLLYYLAIGTSIGLFHLHYHCGGIIGSLLGGIILNIIGFFLIAPLVLTLIWIVTRIFSIKYFYRRYLLVVFITIGIVLILEELLVPLLYGEIPFPPYIPHLACY